jgi:hypothetical protein
MSNINAPFPLTRDDGRPEDVLHVDPTLSQVPVDEILIAVNRAQSVIAAITTNGDREGFNINRDEIIGCMELVDFSLTQIQAMVNAAFRQRCKWPGGE